MESASPHVIEVWVKRLKKNISFLLKGFFQGLRNHMKYVRIKYKGKYVGARKPVEMLYKCGH